MRVVFSPEAEDDLAEIGGFIAADSPRRAIGFVRELRTGCQGLSRQPRRFPVILVREDVPIRRLIQDRYSIFYVAQESEVYILRILHSARDFDKILVPQS